MAPGESRFPRLPACHACYTKKVKCDNRRPKCAPCVRSASECITLGLDGHQPVSRGYISDLEHKVRALQRDLQDAIDDVPEDRPLDAAGSRKRRNSTRSTYSSPTFTEGAGLSFMRPLFADPGWRAHNPTLLQSLSHSARLVEATIPPNPLPSAEDARPIFDKYLSGSHVLNPFLLRRQVEDVYQRVFRSDPDASQPSHRLFRAFMVLAIGAIHPYRRGAHQWHPYGYFLSAMQHFKSGLMSRGIESIQDLLLVGRFGIYHHIGTSIWEITQLCMRLCIEQGLHRPPTARRALLQEQLERRVFWECYVIDRYSSITLDRPLAISDRDIRVLLPVDANDEELEAAEGSISDLDLLPVTPNLRSGPSELTVFFASVRLRQITSKIHGLFQFKDASGGPPSVTATGRIYANLYGLLQELDALRQSNPVFEHPRCVYDTQDWFDLRWMRERLILVRKAMDLVPKRGNMPPRDLLALCLQNATQVITIFCRLYGTQQVTYTRSYFQTLFTAGLSVVFYLSVVADPDAGTIDQAMDALAQCEQGLKELGHDLPDAAQYVAVYEALYRHTSQKLQQSGRWGGLVAADLHPSDAQPGSRLDPVEEGLSHTQLLSGTEPLSEWPLPTPNSLPPATDAPAVDNQPPMPEELLSFGALFWDDTVWNMEAGLGEYAYGNPHSIAAWDGGTFPL
ncbi:fungal-specific transcription factor domain-containing protein [Aspergillus aurantiobrunneus]